MDQVENYRQIVREFLQDFATDDSEAHLIFDVEHDHYTNTSNDHDRCY